MDSCDSCDDIEKVLSEAATELTQVENRNKNNGNGNNSNTAEMEKARKGILKGHPFHGLRPGLRVWCRVLQLQRKSKATPGTVSKKRKTQEDDEEEKDGSVDGESLSISVQLGLIPRGQPGLSSSLSGKANESTNAAIAAANKWRPLVQWLGKDAVKVI